MPTDGCSSGRVGDSLATNDGVPATSRTRDCHNLANATENMNRTRIDATGKRLRLKDGERLNPKSWLGRTSLTGFEREIAPWLGYVDPKHEGGKLMQQITRGTLRATEAWTDGRHAVDDKYVELDYELSWQLHWPL